MIQPPYIKDGTQIADKIINAARHIIDLSVNTLQIAALAVTTAKIAASAVTNAKLANMAAGTIKAAPVGGAAAPVDLSIAAAGQFPLGNGTDVTTGTMSGDVTMGGTGVTLISALAVTTAKVAANAVTAPKIGTLPGARARNSGNITIADLTTVSLTYDTNIENDDSMHSVSVSTDRFTVNTAGVYVISGSALWAAGTATIGAGTFRMLFLYLNGATEIARVQADAVGGTSTGPFQVISTIRRFAAADFITMAARCSTGATGTLIIQAVAEDSPLLSARWIST